MKTTRLLTLAALLAAASLATPAHAQTVLFEETFENELTGVWTETGMWHRARDTNTCMQGIAPFPGGKYVGWWGLNGSCSFDGVWAGDLTLATPVSLPANANDILLSFWSYDDVECDACGWDWRFVYLSDDGGTTWNFLGESNRLWQWYQVGFDLTPWKGKDVLIRFNFDAVDGWSNWGLGWVIDDIKIVADACTPTNFCVAAPNSVGSGATAGFTGSTSIAADDFQLTLTGAPKNQFAHFFYGPEEIAPVALADGFRCVGPGATTLVRLLPSAQIDGAGNLSVDLDFVASFNTKNWITPGSTWRFQCWYRDPMGPGGNGSNVSDGLSVTFCP